MNKLHEVFAVPIFETNLELDNEEIKLFCKEYQQNYESTRKSNNGGYQSNNLPTDNKHINSLVDQIVKHSNIFSESYSLKIKNVISTMWLNINGYKDSNGLHLHSLSIFSGVYYVKTPKDCGSIVFENPAADIMDYAHCVMNFTEFNKYNSSYHWMPAKENILYIFPSWLKHKVEPNMNNDERISISFNTISA